MSSRLLSVTLADSTTVLLWALGRGTILPRIGGPVWDLDASDTEPGALRWRWEDAASSLAEWLDVYQPPIIVEHGLDLPTRDPDTQIPIAYGHVTGVRIVTQEDAEAMGVEQVGDALYMTAEVDPAVAKLLEDGRLPYLSPGLRADYTDDSGRTWPLIVRELTLTLDPRQKTRQPMHATTRPLAAALLSETASMDETTETPDIAETLKALAETVRSLSERLDALESAKMEEPAPDAEADMACDGDAAELSEIAQLRREVEQLRQERARIASEQAVDALLSEHALDAAARPALVALHMRDAGAAAAIVKAAPKRGKGGAGPLKVAPSVGAGVDLGDVTREERASAMVKSGECKSLTEAWNKVAAMTRQGG